MDLKFSFGHGGWVDTRTVPAGRVFSRCSFGDLMCSQCDPFDVMGNGSSVESMDGVHSLIPSHIATRYPWVWMWRVMRKLILLISMTVDIPDIPAIPRRRGNNSCHALISHIQF